jgi:hypothetical protein
MVAKVRFGGACGAIPAAYAEGLLWVVLSHLGSIGPSTGSALLASVRLSEGRLTAVAERPTGTGFNGVRGALPTQLRWSISPWRVIERLWPG